MKFVMLLCLSSALTAPFADMASAQTVDPASASIASALVFQPATITSSASLPVSNDAAPNIAQTPPSAAVVTETATPQTDTVATGTTSDIDPVATQTEIVVTGRVPPPPQDPLQALNIQSFELVQAVDVAVIGPVAAGYEQTIPEPVRNGLRNFLLNLHEPGNFLNFLLQFKIGKAVDTLGRFVINSTVGVAGLFDMAKRRPFNLRYRPNGFANTFGFYGIKTGPFLFLPIIGPTTARDLVGYFLDRLLLPTLVRKPFTQLAYNLPTGVLTAITRRNENKQSIEKLREGATNPYTTLREDYLQARQNDIDELRGRHRLPKITPRPVGQRIP